MITTTIEVSGGVTQEYATLSETMASWGPSVVSWVQFLFQGTTFRLPATLFEGLAVTWLRAQGWHVDKGGAA